MAYSGEPKRARFHRKSISLQVTLLDTNPPIWRRLLVPADMTLAQLHVALQAAMGWDDSHLHEFSVGQRGFGRPDPQARLMGEPSSEDEGTVPLAGILGRAGFKAIYTYDFGDTWEHSILLEKRLPVDSRTAYPVLHGRSTRVSAGRLWRHPRIL